MEAERWTSNSYAQWVEMTHQVARFEGRPDACRENHPVILPAPASDKSPFQLANLALAQRGYRDGGKHDHAAALRCLRVGQLELPTNALQLLTHGQHTDSEVDI